jgi:hypothetical protein
MVKYRRREDFAQDHILIFQVRSIEQTYPHTLWLVKAEQLSVYALDHVGRNIITP